MKKVRIANLVFKILFHVILIVFAILSVAGPILLSNADIINSVLGIETQVGSGSGSNGNIYFNTKFEKGSDVKKASLEIIDETMKEGAVLLKNDNNALPLAKQSKVTLYGAASYYSVHTGQGSSGVQFSSAINERVTFFEGLKNAGLDVNEDMNNYYKSQSVSSVMGSSNFVGGSSQEYQSVVKDINWDSLPDAAKTSKAKAAIMVLARNSGEAEDMYMDTTMDGGDETRVIVSKGKASANKHNDPNGSVGDSLALTANEISVLKGLKALKASKTIDSIIVIMNSASPLQCDFLEDEELGVDACMWVGTIGVNGANAVGKLLTGEYNPSGRTADTFWEESKYNPVYFNFGSIQYGNVDALSNSYFPTMEYQNHRYYVAYQEGIYNGYKYTETRYEDVVTKRANVGTFNYSDVVTYPFGYGLSYSSYTYSNMHVSYDNTKDVYTVTVDVHNDNAERDGKEVVQVYLQKPYTADDIKNGVEKASVELVGFTKIDVPAGETRTATIEVKGKYFAAYDANFEKTYVVGSKDAKDEYLLTAAKDSHDAVNNILQYKKDKGVEIDATKIYKNAGRGDGDKSLVYGKSIVYDNKKYATNDFIKSENENFTPAYKGQQANYGVKSITNQFDDVDFRKVGIFSQDEAKQAYMTRSNWNGTYGKRIVLTANEALREAQKNPAVAQDKIPYPTYGKTGFYEGEDMVDELKLIYLRGKDYNDPLWDELLDQMTWEETCVLLQDGLRYTSGVPSISAPSSTQQNGAVAPVHHRNSGQLNGQSGFRGFAEEFDDEYVDSVPPIFACNGIVAATYNIDLIYRLGLQTGEEAAWAGFNGIYGLGVNIHRGAYCGRTFEYYSEDGYLTGVAAGYEAVGMHEKGVFVLMKHAVLNDQETHRAGLNVWANEQSIREIYSRAMEVSIEIDREYTPCTILGVMTGMNRLGAKWTGGQGFCNTVLRAEYGMRGYVVSDYNSSRPYMSPIQGVLYGNDMPDGSPAGAKGGYDYDGNDLRFKNYATGYGELAWSMRAAAKNVLYTVVNSNTMNGIDGDSTFSTITPQWELAVPVVMRTMRTVFIWIAVLFGVILVSRAAFEVLITVRNKRSGK